MASTCAQHDEAFNFELLHGADDGGNPISLHSSGRVVRATSREAFNHRICPFHNLLHRFFIADAPLCHSDRPWAETLRTMLAFGELHMSCYIQFPALLTISASIHPHILTAHPSFQDPKITTFVRQTSLSKSYRVGWLQECWLR